MRYVYENPTTGLQEEYSQSKCLRACEEEGLVFLGHKRTEGGELIPAERGRRARLTQDPMIEVTNMLEETRRAKDQLNAWGIR